MSDAPGATGRALLLIDFQRDFLAADGRMPVDPAQVEPVLAEAQKAVEQSVAHGDLILKIGNEFRPSDVIGNFFRHHAAVKGSHGASWDKRIDPPSAIYLAKWRSDAFCNPALDAVLRERGVNEVLLTGLFTKACVSATAKSARKRGLSVKVIADATACSTDKSRQIAIDKLRKVGVEII